MFIRKIVLCVLLALCLTSLCFAEEDLTLIADHLYETTYTTDDYWASTPSVETMGVGMACSAVQNGQYRGRNYDWIYADTDLCVVHTTVTDSRPHASVGMSDLSFITGEDGSPIYAKIPLATVDGINDAGVCIQVNVIPQGENGALSHTDTEADDLPGGRVCRLVLDYAANVEEALDLLSRFDIHSEMGTDNELHWMISGPASETDAAIKTVVVEIFPDGMHITEDFIDDKPVMTNFNLSNFDGTALSVGYGMGYERWQILNEYFDQANSVMGTFDLMEKVYYSKVYDLYSENFWYSEYNHFDLLNYYDEETLKSLIGEETYDALAEDGAVYYQPALWDGEADLKGDSSKAGILAPVVAGITAAYEAQDMEKGDLWITIHTAVYDLENLTLDLQVRESQDHLHFTID